MCVHQTSSTIVVVESEHNALSLEERCVDDYKTLDEAGFVPSLAVHDDEEDEDDEGAMSGGGEPKLTSQQVGHARPPNTKTVAPPSWASCVRVLCPDDGSTCVVLELPKGHAAFTVASVVFHDRGGEEFLVVGKRC